MIRIRGDGTVSDSKLFLSEPKLANIISLNKRMKHQGKRCWKSSRIQRRTVDSYGSHLIHQTPKETFPSVIWGELRDMWQELGGFGGMMFTNVSGAHVLLCLDNEEKEKLLLISFGEWSLFTLLSYSISSLVTFHELKEESSRLRYTSNGSRTDSTCQSVSHLPDGCLLKKRVTFYCSLLHNC